MSAGGERSFGWDLLVPQLVHPLKVEIIEAMSWIDEPLSATDVTKALGHGCGVSGASYHLNRLAEAGALEVVGERRVRGGHEKFFFFAAGKHGLVG